MNWRQEAEKLEQLAFDLRLIAANGGRPTLDQLAGAPTLHKWRPTIVLAGALTGFVEGHPKIGPGPIVTSPLYADGDGWARTLSRFYLLSEREPERGSENELT